MSRRTRLSCAVLGSLLIAVLVPSVALAHGPLRKGLEIDHNRQLTMMTGYARSDWKWATVGLQPGRVTVAATLLRCGQAAAPTCGLIADLMRGSRTIRSAEVGCYTSHRTCGQTARVTFDVTKAGVYYIVIQGLGADSIKYRMRVQGNIYPLHCRKYC